MVLEGRRGGEAGNFNRRDITGNAAGWELGGAIFLKNASRCKFALQLLAPRLLILPLLGQRKRLNTRRLNLDAASQRPPETASPPPLPAPDKVINNRVFFPLNELERYQDGNPRVVISISSRGLLVYLSRLFSISLVRDNATLFLLFRFQNLERSFFGEYPTRRGGEKLYALDKSGYGSFLRYRQIFARISSASFGKNRFPSNFINQIFTKRKVRKKYQLEC